MTAPDQDWEWEIGPEQGSTYHSDNDLSSTIAIGIRVSELRQKAGLTVQDIEDYVGVQKATLLALEAGLLEMDEETAESIAMALGVSVDDLKG